MKSIILLLLSFPFAASAQTVRETTFGAGRANVLDTYLTPLEYTGSNLTVQHRTERQLRRLENWSIVAKYAANGAYASSPTDDGHAFDGWFAASGGMLHSWQPYSGIRLGAGALAGGGFGFTYNTRLQNNPAQGRLAFEATALLVADWTFRLKALDRLLRERPLMLRLEAATPVVGCRFSPGFGRSYYEIFSLGHSSGIFHFAHPFNAPTLTLSPRLTIPLRRRTHLVLGYEADLRQAHIAGLKDHAWRHSFVVGFQR